jgi:O-methyltransferase
MNLIYICVFHQKSYINLLELLVNSIEENSGDLINTDILILTTSDFLPNIKEKINNVFNVKYMILDNLTTLFQAGCARLNIFSYENIDKYEKILYLDTDILVAKSLNNLFDLEISSDKIYALEEGTIEHDYHGGQFFNESKDLRSKNLTAFTSGILFFKNTNAIKDLFVSINQHIQDYIYEKHNPIPICLDQPFIIYNAIIQNKYDNQILKDYVQNKHDNILTDKVIYHFPGGPGNYESKYERMASFWSKLVKEKYNNKYIIQVGSHIGNTSNDYLFNKINPDFKYIMIEPVPYLFNMLKENYKSYNNITFLNIAISNYDGVLDLYAPSEKNDFTNLVSWASQLASVNKDHIHTFVPNCIVDNIKVKCKTLNTLINEYNIKEIEYLYTDTEGHDYDILMNLNLSLIKPKNIIFENKHMDGPKHILDINDCSKYLNLLNHFKEYKYFVKNQTLEDTHIKLGEFSEIDNKGKTVCFSDFIKEIRSKETTLVSEERLINLSHQCSKFNNTKYSFVECGVAKGGCLAMMKYCSGINNKIFGFDSFEGMPDIDSDKDISDYNKSDPVYWVGKPLCNGIDSVYDTFDKLKLNMNNVVLVKGFFQDTLNVQKNIDNIGEIAVLRLDGDWYDSTKICLEKLYDKVIDGGVIIIDDYGHFIGAKRATDEFREKYNIRSPLIKTDYTEYYWVKNTNADILLSDTNNIDDDIWTCSDKMRYDIYESFKDKSHYKIAEIGSHKGYSTKVLSKIFSKVYAVDNSIEWTNFNKNFNKDATNITYVMCDIYNNSWDVIPEDVDVSFIDAGHSYECCKSDILNSLKRFKNLKYIILDDYGVWEGVKRIVDEMIQNKTLIFESFIGINDVPGPNGIVKNINEGIICSINRLVNKRYIWQSDNIKFLENGNMDAFGPGSYEFINSSVIKANFGSRIHTITFNKDFTEFISVRTGDNEVVTGSLKI